VRTNSGQSDWAVVLAASTQLPQSWVTRPFPRPSV